MATSRLTLAACFLATSLVFHSAEAEAAAASGARAEKTRRTTKAKTKKKTPTAEDPPPASSSFEDLFADPSQPAPSTPPTDRESGTPALLPLSEATREEPLGWRTESAAEQDAPLEARERATPPPAPPPRPRKPRSGPSGHSGGYLEFGFGRSGWALERDAVAAQVAGRDDVRQFFDGSLRDAAAATFRLGYNVLGHAHLGAQLMATGWDLTTVERGGGGYAGGEIGWHPLALVDTLLEEGLPGQDYYDFWLEAGYGYTLVGKLRAMEGDVTEFGLGFAAFPAPAWLSIGLRLTWYFPDFENYILDYDRRALPGNTIALPNGAGGQFFVANGFLALHFGTGR